MKIDDFRGGVVRVCDGEGSTRGTGFFVSQAGHVLTCDHVVQGMQHLSVTLVDGHNVPATLAPELSLPEQDFAVLKTNVSPDFVVPIEFTGAVGDPVWASGFQMQGQVNDSLPTIGKIAGQTGLEYNFGDRVYKLPEVLRLENALVEPGISGGCAALQQDLVVVGAVNASLPARGGFILPFRAIKDQTCGLFKLLQQNRQTVPRYGKYLNQPALREICNKRADDNLANLETSGRYWSNLYVKRDAVNSVVDRFLLGDSRVLAIVGQTGTGKTNCSAYLTETLKNKFATVLLLAYRVSTQREDQREGLASAVAADLNQAIDELPILSAGDLMRAIAERANSELIVILDGLNELPGTLKATREWFELTWKWMRKNPNVRLLVSSRPEYWNSAKDLFAGDLLYTERPVQSEDESQSPREVQDSFQLQDFTEEEAHEASLLYALPFNQGSNIFRHPLFYNIARKALARRDTSTFSIDRLFHDYIDATVKEVCMAREQPNAFLIRFVLDRLAATLRANKSLWIDREQFLDASSADPSIAQALLSQHMLVEGEGGFRFAFDETAHYLVSQVATKEFEKKAGEDIDWGRFRKEDPIGTDSMSFLVASLEARGKTDSVAKILNDLAAQSHSDDNFESYRQHTLFLRLLQWLHAPANYFPAIVAFVNSCTNHANRVGAHSLTPLIELSGISSTQQLQLLSMLARLENDRDNRWKDWEKLSDSEFWNKPSYGFGISTFRLSLKGVLDRNPEIMITALIEWVKDQTKIFSYSSLSEATVSDVACSILYHSASRWLEPIVDGLARIYQVQDAGYLLFKIIPKYPVEMLDVCERWARDGKFAPTLPIRTAGILLEMRPQSDQMTRLVAILDTMLQQANSPDVQAAIADSFSRNPSTAPRALNLAEELLQKHFPVDPWLLRRLISIEPDRVIRLLDSIIVQSQDLNRREWATSALEELAKIPGRELKLLSVIESYLARYPELGSRLGQVVEELLRATKIGSPEDDALDAWLRANYSKLPSNARVPIIYGVLNRAGRDPAGIPLLRTVIAAETPDDNLGMFVELLSRSSLPMSTRLNLLKPVVRKFDEINPRYQGLLFAITISGDEKFGRFFAEQVALDPTRWSSTVVEYSTRVLAGEDPLDAAGQITMRALEDQHPEGD